jgi:hypothetical protein
MATAPTPEAFAALEEKVRDLTESLNKANKGSSDLGQTFSKAGKQIADGAKGLATGLANGQQGASVFNGAINAGSAALSTLAAAAGPLGTVFDNMQKFAAEYVVRANQQGDALFKSFQDLSRVGGASAEGMTGVFNSMQKFGMTMNQLPEFGAMISQNSEALAMLGGTVSQGAKQFADVAAGIQQSGLQSEFQRMGLSTKNINEGTASYLRLQSLTGASAKKSQEELTAGAAQYIQQQDRLSKLTGKSADALAKEEEARLSDQRYAALTRELEQKAAAARAAGDEAGAKAAEDQIAQNRELMAQTPAALKQGVQDLMSGFVNSPEAQKMYTSLPAMAQEIMSQNFKASEVLTKGATEATGALDRNTALAKAGLSNQVNADFGGLRDLEAKNRAKTSEENAAAAKTEQDKLKEGADKDINNQVALRQAQTATTIAMDNLVQKGVGPVTAGMLALATGIEKIVTAIPGTGDKTSTKATGRGQTTPATAGYGTDVKPEDLTKFVKETVSKAYGAITGPGEPVVTTGKQAHQVLSGDTPKPKVNTGTQAHQVLSGDTPKPKVTAGTQANQILSGTTPKLADTTRTPVGNTSGVQANNILQQAEPGSRYNPVSSGTEPSSSSAATPDLTQTIMTLATNMGTQATSTSELVDLMRRSIAIQDKILQQSRN